ncbi:MAG: hypothetical protein LBR17_04650 [Bacteroidales bacterium]|jgi:hypothetical protein|nr:hypothetical protein [Bacteroidales bacterium]
MKKTFKTSLFMVIVAMLAAGIGFFPDEYRYVYKIRIICEPLTEEEWIAFPCNTLYPQLYFGLPCQVKINSISILE